MVILEMKLVRMVEDCTIGLQLICRWITLLLDILMIQLTQMTTWVVFTCSSDKIAYMAIEYSIGDGEGSS